MIIVSGTITIDPAKIDRARELTSALVAATLQEEGCAQYGYWQSLEQPGVIRVFEQWADDDALNTHMGTPHMAEFMVGAAELGITGVDIIRYDVSESSKLM